jgi:DOPA 4,5-dioxygenase
MLNSEIDMQSEHFPEGFQRDFDAHIYYSSDQKPQAEKLRELAVEKFKKQPVFIGPMVDRLVGPHPLPMFELNFSKDKFQEILFWLMHERKNLNILVHQVTGDDPIDHYAGAIWLGTTQILDDTKLDPSP